VRDKSGSTPFAKALIVKDNAAGLAILNREPKAAEQVCWTWRVWERGSEGLIGYRRNLVWN